MTLPLNAGPRDPTFHFMTTPFINALNPFRIAQSATPTIVRNLPSPHHLELSKVAIYSPPHFLVVNHTKIRAPKSDKMNGEDPPRDPITSPPLSTAWRDTTQRPYQLNPDRMKDEVVTNVLVKAMTQFPSAQFTLALHLINPSAASTGELHEALTKLRSLNSQLQGSQYADFWADLDGDDLCADLIADVSGFEDSLRERIAVLISHAFREVELSHMVSWLGINEDKTRTFITEVCGWTIDEAGNAKKAEIREDVNVDQFSRVVRRAWEETV
ncbi:Eukaryotic translation initiation factor 3 subunit K [Cladobotryum mycophilum]|uniref:Eukaryotic translation initiation factor 3 subunit K n=1 Tax=Cladobotryum mycophilum TaxID=491253 RepID=A0ABR0SVA6_9HYPO